MLLLRCFRDLYLFPDMHAGDPAGQVRSMLSYLKQYNVTHHTPSKPPNTFGTVWIDIEGPQYWGSQSENRDFLSGMISELKSNGVAVGIYASESQW